MGSYFQSPSWVNNIAQNITSPMISAAQIKNTQRENALNRALQVQENQREREFKSKENELSREVEKRGQDLSLKGQMYSALAKSAPKLLPMFMNTMDDIDSNNGTPTGGKPTTDEGVEAVPTNLREEVKMVTDSIERTKDTKGVNSVLQKIKDAFRVGEIDKSTAMALVGALASVVVLIMSGGAVQIPVI